MNNIDYKKDVLKAQPVRLYDILFIGPILVLFGIFLKDIPLLVRIVLIAIGIGTIIYNGKFYLKYSNE